MRVILLITQQTRAQHFLGEQLKKDGHFRLDTMIHLQAGNNDAVDIPVTLIKGAGKGPTFTITAGIHGMEYPTIMSLVELAQELRPEQLKGSVVIMPIVNQPSFFNRVPFRNPMDGLNLNRVCIQAGGEARRYICLYSARRLTAFLRGRFSFDPLLHDR